MSVLSGGDGRAQGFRGLTGTGGKEARDGRVGEISCQRDVKWIVDWKVRKPTRSDKGG